MNRRHFLRTLGTTLTLPALESIGAPSQAAPPTRFVALYFPNGCYPAAWSPQAGPNGLRLGGSLSPLQPFASKTVTVSGLNHRLSGHLGQTSGFLTGVELKPNDEGITQSAVSLDQMIARHIGTDTHLPSLHLGMEPPSQGAFGKNPRSYGNSISWSSPTSKIEPQINPQLAFDQVFYGQTAAGRAAASRQKRLIDRVWSEARPLQQRVSSLDRTKLEQYYDSLRDVEARLEKTLQPPEKDWHPRTTPELNRPEQAGIPTDYAEHMKLMLDILVLALQTDSTRVATHVMGHSISRIVYDFADAKIRAGHHDLSHHRNDPAKIEQYNEVTHWLSSQCAYLTEKMDAIDEGDGSLLDHSLILYGSGMKDGNTHEPLDVPVALIGGASGQLKTGRLIHVPGEDNQLAQLHLSVAKFFGLDLNDFNQATSTPISQL